MKSKSSARTKKVIWVSLVCFALCSLARAADEAVFSGPQVGEALRPFKAVGVYDQDAGKEFDFVTQANGGPMLLIFVNEFNRPSAALVRTLMQYGVMRKKDGLTTAVIRLDADITAGTEQLKRARHALVEKVPVAISVDGAEGPGAYGLNRNVQLTIIVANKNKVTANFALVQPSVQADTERIIKEVIKLIGGEVPSLAELGGRQYMPRAKKAMKRKTADAPAGREQADEQLVTLLRQVIAKQATPEQVDSAAKALEAYVKDHESARADLGKRTHTVVNSDVFERYGTPKAREYLSKWAKEYGPKDEKAKEKSN